MSSNPWHRFMDQQLAELNQWQREVHKYLIDRGCPWLDALEAARLCHE